MADAQFGIQVIAEAVVACPEPEQIVILISASESKTNKQTNKKPVQILIIDDIIAIIQVFKARIKKQSDFDRSSSLNLSTIMT